MIGPIWGVKLRHRSRRALRATSLVAVAGLATAGMFTAGASAASKNDPGVTKKSVKLGYIFSETGVAGSTFKNAGKACQARIDRQNAKGGVNGRKIQMEIVDDASSGANLTATQDLVKNRNVFAIVNNSSFAFLSYRYMLDQGVPMVGGGYDGTYYGQKGNEDIISSLGNAAPFTGLSYDTTAKVMKQLGAKKSRRTRLRHRRRRPPRRPRRSRSTRYPRSASRPCTPTPASTSAPPTSGRSCSASRTPVPTRCTCRWWRRATSPSCRASTQNGVKMKANVLATGYGQDLLDSPIASTLKSNTVLFQTYKPVEVKDKATKQFQADLKKYAGLTGVPDYGQYTGYITCELAILGLQNAGKTPTRQGFIDGLHNLGTYDQAGLRAHRSTSASPTSGSTRRRAARTSRR